MKRRAFGYIRVSSVDQNEDRQQKALEQLEIQKSDIYMDKQSGKDFHRPAYENMLKEVRKGDIIYILSLDRLGRNYEEIQTQWRRITKEMDVDICILDMPLLDTRRGKDLVGTFMADIVLQILSFVAQKERENIRERQEQGIAAARVRGVQFGRPQKELPEDFEQWVAAWQMRKISMTELLENCHISRSTFYRRRKAKENERV